MTLFRYPSKATFRHNTRCNTYCILFEVSYVGINTFETNVTKLVVTYA